MERKARQLMEILDDELNHHPPGYVSRNYVIYNDAFASRRKSQPPYIWLKIQNPRGRKGKPKPTDPDEFKIILDMYQIPFIPAHISAFEERLTNNGFEIPPVDLEGRCYGGEPSDFYAGSVKGELTLENFDRVFKAITESFQETLQKRDKYQRPGRAPGKDNRGWILEALTEKIQWLHQRFKKVYAGETPRPPPPKRRKLF